MLSVTYNTTNSDWIKTINGALAKYNEFVVGDAKYNINVIFDNSSDYLARCGPTGYTTAGTLDGKTISVPNTIAKLQGVETNATYDINLTISTYFNWAFTNHVLYNQIHAESVILHELGHALGIIGATPGNSSFYYTPFSVWAYDNPSKIDSTSPHIDHSSSVFYKFGIYGDRKNLTVDDKKLLSEISVPTTGNDTIFIVGDYIDGGAGVDTAIYLHDYDKFSSSDITLTNIEYLNFAGDSAMDFQQDGVYRLYQAAFNRNPDLDGFDYWVEQDLTISEITQIWMYTPEFADIYSGQDLIFALYHHVLDRVPSQGEYDWWANSGMEDHQMVYQFALSAENAATDYMMIV